MNWEVRTMRSKISSFKPSLPVIRKDFARFWPVWGSYLAIWLLFLPIGIVRSGAYLMDQSIHREIISSGQHFSVVMSIIYGFLSAAAVWSYLYNHRSVSLYHALPVPREGMFVSHFLSGMGFMVLPNVAVLLLSWLACVGNHCAGAFSCLMLWLGAVCLQNLFFFCFATLLAMLTGNLPTHAGLYGILSFAAFVCEHLIRNLSVILIYGLTEGESRLVFLAPPIKMMQSYSSFYFRWQEDPQAALQFPMLLAYGAAGLVLALLALLLYRKRDSERAGDVIAVPFLRPVAKYCFAFGCALVLGSVLYLVIFDQAETLPALLISLLLGGLIGYLAAAMLLKKSFRVFDKKTVLGFCAFALVIVGGMACIQADVFGVGKWVPELSQVESAFVQSWGDTVSCDRTDPEMLQKVLELHGAVIRRGPELRPGEKDVSCTIHYQLAGGREVERVYRIPWSEAYAADGTHPAHFLTGLMRQTEAVLKSKLPPEDATVVSIGLWLGDASFYFSPDQYGGSYIYLDTKDFAPVLEAVREDILAGDYGVWKPLGATQSVAYSMDIDYGYPSARGSGRDVTDTNRYLPFTLEEAPRTYELLCRLGYLKEID